MSKQDIREAEKLYKDTQEEAKKKQGSPVGDARTNLKKTDGPGGRLTVLPTSGSATTATKSNSTGTTSSPLSQEAFKKAVEALFLQDVIKDKKNARVEEILDIYED